MPDACAGPGLRRALAPQAQSKEERVKRRKTKREQRAKAATIEREKLLAVMGDMVANAKQVMVRWGAPWGLATRASGPGRLPTC